MQLVHIRINILHCNIFQFIIYLLSIPVSITRPLELVHNYTQECWAHFSSVHRFLCHAPHKQVYVVCKETKTY